MSRLRIVCKGERRTIGSFSAGYPRINGRPAMFTDLEIFAVDDEGKETPITNVSRVEWSVAQGTEPAGAIVHFHDVDVEIEAEVRAQAIIGTIPPMIWRCDGCRAECTENAKQHMDRCRNGEPHEWRRKASDGTRVCERCGRYTGGAKLCDVCL